MRTHWRRRIGRTVILHLPEQTIEGVLVYVSGSNLVLRGAVIPGPGGKPVAVDGEAVVERSRVVFGQVT